MSFYVRRRRQDCEDEVILEEYPSEYPRTLLILVSIRNELQRRDPKPEAKFPALRAAVELAMIGQSNRDRWDEVNQFGESKLARLWQEHERVLIDVPFLSRGMRGTLLQSLVYAATAMRYNQSDDASISNFLLEALARGALADATRHL